MKVVFATTALVTAAVAFSVGGFRRQGVRVVSASTVTVIGEWRYRPALRKTRLCPS